MKKKQDIKKAVAVGFYCKAKASNSAAIGYKAVTTEEKECVVRLKNKTLFKGILNKKDIEEIGNFFIELSESVRKGIMEKIIQDEKIFYKASKGMYCISAHKIKKK